MKKISKLHLSLSEEMKNKLQEISEQKEIPMTTIVKQLIIEYIKKESK